MSKKKNLAQLHQEQSNLTTRYFDSDEYIQPVVADVSKQLDKLPTRIYKLVRHEDGKVNLKKMDDRFKMPPKLFGKRIRFQTGLVSRYYKNKTISSLGVMATGQKGCGKTEQLYDIANTIMDQHDIPTIIIEDPLPKAVVENTIKAIGQCIVFIDEHEKIYQPKRHNDTSEGVDENELLTLYSDKSLEKVLFLISANKVHELSPYILNRTSRFTFRFTYTGADKDAVEDVCKHFKLGPDKTEFLTEYVEDTNSSIDITISLADIATEYKDTKELKEVFDVMNVPKPKIWQWRVMTPTGTDAGLECWTDRKKLHIRDLQDKGPDGKPKEYVIHAQTFYMNYRHNSNMQCFVVKGLAGASDNVTLGFTCMGPARNKEEEEIDPITFFPLSPSKQTSGFGK